MQLSIPQIEALIESPRNQAKLIEAQRHQTRLKMHVDGVGISAILDKVRPLLTESKMTNFSHLLEAWSKPLFDEMSSSLFKIHNAKGRVSKWNFNDEDESNEEFYKIVNKSYLGASPRYFYENKGYKYLLCAPNTVVLTDMPRVFIDEVNGTTKVIDPVTNEVKLFTITEPYNVVVPVESQHDIEIKGGRVQYIIVKSEVKTEKGKIERYFVVDSYNYHVFIKDGENLSWQDSITHDLGYCPATTISLTDRLTECEIQKKSPFSDALDLADEYVIAKTAIKNSQMRTAYKKEWEIETREQCGRSDCNDGMIYDDVTNNSVACGSCAELKRRNKSAFGRLIKIPNPDLLSESALRIYTNPVGENTSDVALLNYQLEVLQQIAQKIKDTCLGEGFTQDNPNVSKNQMQVMSNYDSIESVLNFWSNDVSSVWKFQNDTIARLAFSSFENSAFSLGNKYFLKTEEQIQATLKLARENGEPNYILEQIRLEQVSTKYKNNPEALERTLILEQLEPLKEYNTAEIQSLLSAGVVTTQQFMLKVQFVDLINRYERENGTIHIIDNDFNRSVEIVKEQLIKYIEDGKQEQETTVSEAD